MAAPNIVNVSSIRGKTKGQSITTSLADVITCSANNVFKVNGMYISNILENAITVDVGFYDVSATSTFYIIKGLIIPGGASIDVLDKSIYLEEGDKIQVSSNTTSAAQIVLSYEEISDA